MHLAQLNIATPVDDLESATMQEFVDNLDRINGLAENSDGFVWRLKDETDNATQIALPQYPNAIVNMSVWRSPEHLKSFMFKTDHASFLARKKQWFTPMGQASYVLWWIEEGHIPSLDEAAERLQQLQKNGESPLAFSFKKLFEPPQNASNSED